MRSLIAVLVVASACSGLPAPRIPQAGQAVQATHGVGERYRAHQRCGLVARTSQDLVECMRTEGYMFIAQRPEYPSPECWAVRNSETATTNLPPHCFEHAIGTTH